MTLPGASYTDLSLTKVAKNGFPGTDPEHADLLRQLARRVSSVQGEHDFFRVACDRFDKLYFSDTFTTGGADLWPEDKSARTVGRAHVSINTPKVYVDVPAALLAVPPVESMLATDTTDEARDAASKLERLYVAWKNDQDYDLKLHKATTVSSLYGRTASRVIYDTDDEPGSTGKPEVEIIEQPRNLWFGWKSDEYTELEWAAYVIRYEPNALMEEYGVDVTDFRLPDGSTMPLVSIPSALQFTQSDTQQNRAWLNFGDARIEVWDYWYRKPVWSNGKYQKMVTCNAVFAGNACIQGPTEYPEYDGTLPYVPLMHTFIPGVPNGRSELHDMEQLIREKFERVTAGAQMIANAVAGDYWQLVGPDAPIRVPAGLKPKRNELVGPGPGNRIETITPFIAQFQLEQYLGRLDRESAAVSGLNDLLLGLAPAQVLSSSKAINALVANYESRISMPRKLLYEWRRSTWKLALKVWAKRDSKVKAIIDAGAGFLEIIDPSLSPRDDMETAQRAINLMNAKIWSQRTAMGAAGIDDPETEQDLIREERTDATMFPAEVQVMAQLLQALQSMGVTPPPGVEQQAQGQLASGQEALRQSLGAATPVNSTGMQSPDTQGITPPIEGAPPEAGGQQPPFAAAAQPAILQGMIQGGQATSRIKTQATLGRR